jgi:ribosomal protein S18 acetylase RimI-like enzyme
LAHAFDVAAAEEMTQVCLYVDSDNTHAAPAVYRRAGFEVRTSFHAYTRTLTGEAGQS